MKVKRLAISSKLLTEHFGAGSEAYRVEHGVPIDAKLRDVRLAGRDPADGRFIEFLYEHESFPELAEWDDMWSAPHIEPLFRRAP